MKINKHDKQYTHYTSVREDITRGNGVSIRSDPVPCRLTFTFDLDKRGAFWQYF